LFLLAASNVPRLSHFRIFDFVLSALCLRRFCTISALCLRRIWADKFGVFVATKSLNLNVGDLLAFKFSGRSRDFEISLFANSDRNLFAFYFTKDKIAPKRSVDLDYFRTFS